MASQNKNIVTANYFNRESKKRWLIREAGEPIETAQAFESVIATGVTFDWASSLENEHGCTTVAICTTAVGSNKTTTKPKLKEGQVELLFTGLGFIDTAGKNVKKCIELNLTSDGKMVATLKREKVQKKKEAKKKNPQLAEV